MPAEIMSIIRDEYINRPEFDPSLIKRVSSACEGICKWVIAISVYDKTYKYITPKQVLFDEALEKLEKQRMVLQSKEAEVAVVERKLEVLYKELWSKQMENDVLTDKIEITRVRLERAEKLKSGLSGEQARWTDKIDELSHDFDGIVGNILLSAAIIAYLGPFTYRYRQESIKSWVKL